MFKVKRRLIMLAALAFAAASLVSCARDADAHTHSFTPTLVGITENHTEYIEGESPYIDGLTAEMRCDCGQTDPLYDPLTCSDEPLTRDDTSVAVHCGNIEIEMPVSVKRVWRIAFAGDSLTEGAWNRRDMQYSVFVKKALRREVEIGNFGVSGISVTGYGGLFGDPELRYEKQEVFTRCVEFAPDVLYIMLGTNDAFDWTNAEPVFEENYRSLISSFRAALPECELVIVTTPPTADGNTFSISNDVISDSIVPIEKKLAEELGLPLFDANAILDSYEDGFDALCIDGVHFSDVGAQYVGGIFTEKTVELTGIEY